MTIDERLDRLVERHEALTQTVEHLALQGEEHEKRLRKQGEEHDQRLRKQGELLDRLIAVVGQDSENIRALARIAEIHDHRISQLESGESL